MVEPFLHFFGFLLFLIILVMSIFDLNKLIRQYQNNNIRCFLVHQNKKLKNSGTIFHTTCTKGRKWPRKPGKKLSMLSDNQGLVNQPFSIIQLVLDSKALKSKSSRCAMCLIFKEQNPNFHSSLSPFFPTSKMQIIRETNLRFKTWQGSMIKIETTWEPSWFLTCQLRHSGMWKMPNLFWSVKKRTSLKVKSIKSSNPS